MEKFLLFSNTKNEIVVWQNKQNIKEKISLFGVLYEIRQMLVSA